MKSRFIFFYQDERYLCFICIAQLLYAIVEAFDIIQVTTLFVQHNLQPVALKFFILRKLKMFCNCAIQLSITMLYCVWKVRRNGINAFNSFALLPKHLITRMTEISNKILLGAHKMHLEIFIIEPIFTISWSNKLDARFDVNQVNTFAMKPIFVTINTKKVSPCSLHLRRCCFGGVS